MIHINDGDNFTKLNLRRIHVDYVSKHICVERGATVLTIGRGAGGHERVVRRTEGGREPVPCVLRPR